MRNRPDLNGLKLANPIHFLAVGFGLGLAPKAPGTFGTLAGFLLLPLWLMTPAWGYVALTVLASLAGIYICGKTADDMGTHDHGAIVWDEVVGLLITFFLVPISAVSVVLGFVLFRIFDILKPWPISWLDKQVSGGLGIMLDDIVAGLLACVSLHLILQVL